jgi:hypothetical protein
MRRFRQFVASLLVVTIPSLGVPLPAHAGMVGTEKAITPAQVLALGRMLDREEVRAQLERHGVAVEEIRERLGALTDAEAALLAERIDHLPAGGDVLGVLLTVFIILLVTDILGLTKVFPFTRAACDRGRC